MATIEVQDYAFIETAPTSRGTRRGASADRASARRDFLRAGVGMSLMIGGLSARAQTTGGVIFGFPLRQATEDLVATLLRDLQPRYRPDLGTRPVFVAGLGGATAMMAVAHAAPDGSAVLLTSSSAMTLLPILKKLPLDPEKTLRPVAGLGEVGYGVIVGPAVPADVTTMADYLRWAQANPGLAMYGLPGRGTSPHFIGLEIARLSDVPLKSVGYQGLQPILQDVATGSMPAAVTVLPNGSDPVNYPMVRVLAVSSRTRWPDLPNVPTLLELGLAETPTVDSVGFFTAIGTPDRKVAELRDALSTVLRGPALIAAMGAIGLQPMPADVDYALQIASERTEWQARVDRRHFGFES